jgi:hypothetical protein
MIFRVKRFNEYNDLSTDEILTLAYMVDFNIGGGNIDFSPLYEAVDITDIYKSKNSKSAFIKKYPSIGDYKRNVDSVIASSSTLKKIFSSGDVVNPSNPFDVEIAGTRIVVDNDMIKKRAFELYNKFGDLNFLKKYCSETDKLENSLLKFSDGNDKLDHHFLSLPAGITCPGASSCLSLYDPELDVFMIGSNNKGGICYSAASEERRPNVREKVYKNLYLIKYHLSKGVDKLADFLVESLEANLSIRVLRIHEDGDFFSPDYLRAWILTAMRHKTTHFYFYTKSAKFLYHVLKDYPNGLPKNMVGILSDGYTKTQEPAVIKLLEMGYRMAKVFDTYDDANRAGLVVDKTDAYAMDPEYKGDIALVYHGTGLGGSKYAKLANSNEKDERRHKNKDDKAHYIKTTDRIKYNLSKDE